MIVGHFSLNVRIYAVLKLKESNITIGSVGVYNVGLLYSV